MLHRSFVLAAAVLTALAPAAPAQAAPRVGEPAPAFTAVDSNGKQISLADFRGKLVVLEWTNSDCPFVRKHYGAGNMQALQKEAAKNGVVWLSIISSAPGQQGHLDGAGANRLTRERNAAPAHVLLDPSGEIGRAYAAKTTPHMYLVDAAGKLLYMGGIDSIPSPDPADIAKAKPYLRTAMTEALAGKAVTDTVTRPYGCSVKYAAKS
jgi:peroxiredoxin